MSAVWWKKLIRPPKTKIKATPTIPTTPTKETTPVSTKEQLVQLMVQMDVDSILTNPLAKITIMTMYTSSSHELIKEVLTPSRVRSLVGVSLERFFHESHLSPSLTLSRLSELFDQEPASNYARHDIETLIQEFRMLGG